MSTARAHARRRPSALIGAALVALLAGCSTPEHKEEPPRGPVRFAVLAAPEIGSDDGDLALAVTRLSREKDLAFVLVPGPLMAGDAGATALELLRNDLGQIAAPTYVALSGAARVASGATTVPPAAPGAPPGAAALAAEDVLAALEPFGPGPGHALSYVARPPRAPDFAVNVLAPNARGAVPSLTPDTRRWIVCLALGTGSPADVQPGTVPDLIVRPDETGGLSLERFAGFDGTLDLRVPRFSRSRSYVLVTVFPLRIEANLVGIEGEAGPSRGVDFPPLRRPPKD